MQGKKPKANEKQIKMKSNNVLAEFIKELKRQAHKENAKIWKKVALELEKPASRKRIVNLRKINRLAKEGETIIVPGKVLGDGLLEKRLEIAAYTFSDSAIKKITESKSKAYLLKDFIKTNPKGKKTRIIA